MGSKAGGILPLIGIAAAVAATAFSGGAAAPALAGVAEGVAGGGLAAGEAIAGASALGAAEAGMGVAASEAAMFGGEAALAGTEAAGAVTAAQGGAGLAGLETAAAAEGGAGLAGTEALAGAETVTAAQGGAAAQLNSLDAFAAEHGLQFGEGGKLALANPTNATPVPPGFDPSAALTPPDSGVWSWVKDNKDVIGLGMSAGGAVSSGVQNYQTAQAREGQLQLQAAQDSMEMEEKARDAQLRLSHTLAAQNSFFEARGIPTGGGSALSAANSAESAADRAITSIAAMQQLGQSAARYGSSAATRNKAGAVVGSLLDFGGALADTYDFTPTGRRTGRRFLI